MASLQRRAHILRRAPDPIIRAPPLAATAAPAAPSATMLGRGEVGGRCMRMEAACSAATPRARSAPTPSTPPPRTPRIPAPTTPPPPPSKAAKRTIPADQWNQRLAQVAVSKDDMNRLVMDFLVTEGYVDAARAFQGESGAAPGVDLGEIAGRMEIRAAVQGGRVEDAIDKVNDLDPEVRAFCAKGGREGAAAGICFAEGARPSVACAAPRPTAPPPPTPPRSSRSSRACSSTCSSSG